jgi:hypothetical protein
MSRGMRARTVTMRMRRKKHHKPMMDQCRMCMIEGIVEPVMPTGMKARIATMRKWRKKHHKPTMVQYRLWRTPGIVLESVKIGQYISDM